MLTWTCSHVGLWPNAWSRTLRSEHIDRPWSPPVYRSSTGWFTVTAYSEIPSPGGIVIPASVWRTTAQMNFCGPPAVNDVLIERQVRGAIPARTNEKHRYREAA